MLGQENTSKLISLTSSNLNLNFHSFSSSCQLYIMDQTWETDKQHTGKEVKNSEMSLGIRRMTSCVGKIKETKAAEFQKKERSATHRFLLLQAFPHYFISEINIFISLNNRYKEEPAIPPRCTIADQKVEMYNAV